MFILIKEKDNEHSFLHFESEKDLREHLEAMWKYTNWHLVAVVRDASNKNIDKFVGVN